jgi:hypothetical protein
MTKNVNGAAAIVAAKPIGARLYWQGALRTVAAARHWPARCEGIEGIEAARARLQCT